MNCRKQPVSTHCPEGIPMGDLTAVIFDADIPRDRDQKNTVFS